MTYVLYSFNSKEWTPKCIQKPFRYMCIHTVIFGYLCYYDQIRNCWKHTFAPSFAPLVSCHFSPILFTKPTGKISCLSAAICTDLFYARKYEAFMFFFATCLCYLQFAWSCCSFQSSFDYDFHIFSPSDVLASNHFVTKTWQIWS